MIKKSVKFTEIYAPAINGGYQEIPIQNLIIGQPCYLLLDNGNFVRTSPVQSWTIYGHTEICTQNTAYYR